MCMLCFVLINGGGFVVVVVLFSLSHVWTLFSNDSSHSCIRLFLLLLLLLTAEKSG